MLNRLGCAIFLIVGLLTGSVPPSAAQAASPPVYDPANGHWYQAVPVSGMGIDWPTARAAAEALSYAGYPGHLATITADEEQQFVSSHLPVRQQPNWWLGGYQDKTAPDYVAPGGGWRWLTGELWGEYTNWAGGGGGDPNGVNVLQLDTHSSNTSNLWSVFPAQQKIGGYLVEYEPAARPGSVAGLLLFPPALVGGQSGVAQVQLAHRAGPEGVVIRLTSNNPAVATVPATVTVPAGAGTASFPVATAPVTAPTTVLLRAGLRDRAATATLSVQPTLPPGSNLLVNGSFEEPRLPASTPAELLDGQSLPGWTVTGIIQCTVDLVASSVRQPAPGAGEQSLNLVGFRPISGIEQTIDTEPGHEYVFSGWLAQDTGLPAAFTARADVTLNGQLLVKLYHRDPQTAPNNMRWEPFAYRFRANAAQTTLSIRDSTQVSHKGLALDDLAVTPLERYPSPPPPLPPPSPNLLENGSFERPDVSNSPVAWGYTYGPGPEHPLKNYGGPTIPGWEIAEGTIDVVRQQWGAIDQWPAADGLQSIDLVGSPGTGKIEQSFLTEPGRDYVLSGYLSQNPLLAGATVDVFIDDTFLGQVTHLGRYFDPTRWTFFVLPFRATTPLTTLAISDDTSANDTLGALLDGLAVTPADAVPVPAPGSLPIPPTHLLARPVKGQIELTWDDNSSDETSFTILRSSSPFQNNQLVTLGPNVTHYVDRDVQPGVTYDYSLRVESEIGISPGVGVARAIFGIDPPGPAGALLVGDVDGVSRHDPLTGAQIEVLARYPAYGLGVSGGMALGPDRLLYLCNGGNKVLRLDPKTGDYRGVFVLTDSGGLNLPRGLAFGPDGNLYVASNGSQQVLRYDGRTGAFLDVFVPKGRGGLGRPTDLLFGPDGSLLALSSGFGTVFRYNGRTGAFLGALQDPGPGIMDGPGGMALGPDGNLYVTSFGTGSVLRFNPATGAFRDVFVAPGSGGLTIATGLTFGADGDLYVVSKNTHNVLRYDGRTGAFLRVLFTGDPTALLYLPGNNLRQRALRLRHPG